MESKNAANIWETIMHRKSINIRSYTSSKHHLRATKTIILALLQNQMRKQTNWINLTIVSGQWTNKTIKFAWNLMTPVANSTSQELKFQEVSLSVNVCSRIAIREISATLIWWIPNASSLGRRKEKGRKARSLTMTWLKQRTGSLNWNQNLAALAKNLKLCVQVMKASSNLDIATSRNCMLSKIMQTSWRFRTMICKENLTNLY